jgi:hypothetical protein
LKFNKMVFRQRVFDKTQIQSSDHTNQQYNSTTVQQNNRTTEQDQLTQMFKPRETNSI